MEYVIYGLIIFAFFIAGFIFYRAIKIGRRANQSLEKWLK